MCVYSMAILIRIQKNEDERCDLTDTIDSDQDKRHCYLAIKAHKLNDKSQTRLPPESLR